MSICSIPPELQSHILLFLEIDDQVVAAETCSLWHQLLFSKTAQARRYVKSENPDSTLASIHQLLIPADQYKLSCTIQNGDVLSYKLLSIRDGGDSTNYDIKNISASAFLDEPPLGRRGQAEAGENPPLRGSMHIIHSPERSTMHRVQCANTATIRELITSFVNGAQSEMKEAEVRTDLLQEVVVSLQEVLDIDWRKPGFPLIVTHCFLGKISSVIQPNEG
ncbi:hypothetical protein TWF718_007612 [Orbilia javanica]|uniref:F-box domain-containing protein n=1 Tax=Orbilia javanica TaxID=47235 RepID=A0AAN8RNP4_9PEZI